MRTSEGLTPEQKRRSFLYALLIVFCLLVIAGLILFVRFPGPGELQQAGNRKQDPELSDRRDRIILDLTWDPDERLLWGKQKIILAEREDRQAEDIVLRSWSGAYIYPMYSPAATAELFELCYGGSFSAGGLLLDRILVNGQEQNRDTAFADSSHTTVKVPAAKGNAAEGAEIDLEWRVLVPECANRFGINNGIAALGNVFPVPAVYDRGWRTDPVTGVGDPFLSECMDWQVSLQVPKGYTAVYSGNGTFEETDTQRIYQIEARAARDLGLAISDRWVNRSSSVNGCRINCYGTDVQRTELMLKTAVSAMRLYESLWGDYAWPCLNIATVDMPFSGMEYPGMLMISDSIRDMELEVAVAHETAHQWWYAMVGNDPFTDSWMDESLAVWAEMRWIAKAYGAKARAQYEYLVVEKAMRTEMGDLTPASPLRSFNTMEEYSGYVYERGAAFWTAMEIMLGSEQLDTALQTYKQANLFGIADRKNLIAVLSEAASTDLTAFAEDYLDTVIHPQ